MADPAPKWAAVLTESGIPLGGGPKRTSLSGYESVATMRASGAHLTPTRLFLEEEGNRFIKGGVMHTVKEVHTLVGFFGELASLRDREEITVDWRFDRTYAALLVMRDWTVYLPSVLMAVRSYRTLVDQVYGGKDALLLRQKTRPLADHGFFSDFTVRSERFSDALTDLSISQLHFPVFKGMVADLLADAVEVASKLAILLRIAGTDEKPLIEDECHYCAELIHRLQWFAAIASRSADY